MPILIIVSLQAVVTNAFDFRFELLQTLLTYQFLGVFNRLDPQRQRAVVFNDTMIQVRLPC